MLIEISKKHNVFGFVFILNEFFDKPTIIENYKLHLGATLLFIDNYVFIM